MTPISRVATLAVAGALALLVALAGVGWQLDQARRHEWQAQVDGYLLQHLRTTTEDYLAIGLQLDQMNALQNVIEREKSAFAQIVAIDVFSASGTVLYSTDVDNRGQQAPEDWRQRLTQATAWQLESSNLRQVGLRFDNDLGQAAGAVVVTLSTVISPATLVQWKEQAQSAVQWLLFALLVVLVAGGGTYVALARMLRPYDDAARTLQGGKPRTEGALVQAARRQIERWNERRERYQQAREQLEALDGKP